MDSGPRPGAAARSAVLWLALPVALVVLAGGLLYGGGRPEPALAGLDSAGAGVEWALPVVRALWDLSVVATVGAAVLAVLLPLRRGELADDARRALRAGAVAAAAGVVLALALAVLSLADVAPGATATPAALAGNITVWAPSRAALYAAALAAVAAIAMAVAATRDAPVTRLVLALLVPVPVLFQGHSAASSDHLLAVTSLVVHVLSASLWVGGLAGLVGYALLGGRALAAAVPRFSRLALVCYLAVALSGAGNAASRMDSPAELVTTAYGRLVLGKVLALGVLGLTADRLRRRVVPALAADPATGRPGRPARRAFTRFAVVEVLVMAGTVGLAVALSRTPTPVPAEPASTSVAQDELGYAMPPAPTVSRVLFDVWPDWVFLTVSAVAVGLYLAGVVRLRRRGDRWPVGRTLAWVGGWLLAVATTCSGLGRYGAVAFSFHLAQHLLLAVLVPIPLVLGAPVTLALRALRRGRDGRRGWREWLLAALHARWMTVVGHPVSGLAVVVASFYGLYSTPLFGDLVSGHVGHVAMNTFFLGGGYLLSWTVCRIDHSPVSTRHLGRIVAVVAAASFLAVFAVALAGSTSVIARDWYGPLDRPWHPDLLADQHLGGGLTWAFGVVPVLLVALALVVEWAWGDEETVRRLDRPADRDRDTELAADDAHPAALAARSESSDR